MALIRNKDSLKLAGREGAGKAGKAEKLWRVEKSEKVGFKSRKKLTDGVHVSRPLLDDEDGSRIVLGVGVWLFTVDAWFTRFSRR